MINTLIFNNNKITPDQQKQIGYTRCLITINNQLYWIFQEFKNNNYKLVITSLETNQCILQIPVNINAEYESTNRYNVIKFSNTILWIGKESSTISDVTENIEYSFWVINFENLTFIEYKTLFSVDKIRPIGEKYFYVFDDSDELNLTELEIVDIDVGIYDWSDLLLLNDKITPVAYMPKYCKIYYITSPLENFTNFCRINKNEIKCDFLDADLKIVSSFDFTKLFPNYTPIETKDKFDEIDRIIVINDDCLLFFEYRKIKVNNSGKFIIESGITNIYCWDFKINQEINFSNYELNEHIFNVIPYRSDNVIKYQAHEWFPGGSWKKNYSSICDSIIV